MPAFSATGFIALLVAFTLAMLFLTWRRQHLEHGVEGFFAANRNLGLLGGMLTLSISWMWADLFFSASQIGHDSGWPGLFWFMLPAFACFFFYGFLAKKIRDIMPKGYTLPELLQQRYGSSSKAVHMTFSAVFLIFQLFVLGLNATIAGFLFEAALGINYYLTACGVVFMALTYSLISGLRASIYTDIIQTVLLFGLTFVLLPWALSHIDISQMLATATSGAAGDKTSIANFDVVWTLAIPMVVAQFTMPVVDQMFFQRAIAIRDKKLIMPIFTWAGILAALSLALYGAFGFIGVHLANTGAVTIADSQMVLVDVLRELLPEAALYIFALVFFAGTFSTIDSIYCAISSLFSIDIYRRYFKPDAGDEKLINAGRLSMIGAAFLTCVIALFQLKILWMLFILGTIAASAMVPIVFSLFSKTIGAKTVVASVMTSFVLTAPTTIYGNVTGNSDMVALSSIASVAIGIIICTLGIACARQKAN